MRHLRPTLILVAALGICAALGGLRAYADRQAALAGLPRSAPNLVRLDWAAEDTPDAPTPLVAPGDLAALRQRLALLRQVAARPPALTRILVALDPLDRTAEVAADDLRLSNAPGAARLLGPALAQTNALRDQLVNARLAQSRHAVLLPVAAGLLWLVGVLAWLVGWSPLRGLGRWRLGSALALGGGAALAALGWVATGGAWTLDQTYAPTGPVMPAGIVGGSALLVLLVNVTLGTGFSHLAPPRRPVGRPFIPVPSAQLVQRLRAAPPGPAVLVAGAVSGLGGLAAALGAALVLGWAVGGPVATLTVLPHTPLLAAHLAALLSVIGTGLALPFTPFVAYACHRLAARNER
jgi:hypothetical protein